MASPESLVAASQTIRGLFDQGTIPADVATAIVDAYDHLGGANLSVAVRSSDEQVMTVRTDTGVEERPVPDALRRSPV